MAEMQIRVDVRRRGKFSISTQSAQTRGLFLFEFLRKSSCNRETSPSLQGKRELWTKQRLDALLKATNLSSARRLNDCA